MLREVFEACQTVWAVSMTCSSPKKKKIRQSKNMSDTVSVVCQYRTHVRHRLHQMCLCFLAHNIIGLNSTLINN